MGAQPLSIVRQVWRHAPTVGTVWMPTIDDIAGPSPRFRQGPGLSSDLEDLPAIDHSTDSYWTPGVSSGTTRAASGYGSQRVLWADCDEGYDSAMLEALRPSFSWETSPGHAQAVWLMSEDITPDEYCADGLMGLLATALAADPSGVDIGQLLRVPGSTHHKRGTVLGRVLHSEGRAVSRSKILARVARGLGLPISVVAHLSTTSPMGDRSQVLWSIERACSEAGVSPELCFLLIRASGWDKWRHSPERLRRDVLRAYERASATPPGVAGDEPEDSGPEPWRLDTLADFGQITRQPARWVLPGVIPEAGCGLLVAAPKVGKTRIALELALGLATGQSPLGISVPRPTPVGMLSLEDGQYLLSTRIEQELNREGSPRWRSHWSGYITPDLSWHPPQSMPLHASFSPVDLSQAEDLARMSETIQAYGLRLLIIDTLSMAMGKLDVSSSSDMYGMLKLIKSVGKSHGCSILFVHHTRKRAFDRPESVQEMILGSTALHAWADYIMSVAPPEPDSDALRLAVQTKYGSDLHYLDENLKVFPKRGDFELQVP